MKQQDIQLTQFINKTTNKMKKLSLLFAVIFAATTMFAETATWVPSEQEYPNAQAIETVTFGANDAITLTFAKGTNNNAPKYYNAGTAVRLYGGNTLTVSVGSELMSEIVFTFSAGEGTNEITASAGNYESGTWTGSASEITFTVGGNSGHRRIASISVTYAAGGASGDTTSQDTTPVIVPVTMETLTFNANIWNVADVNEKYAAWVWGDNLEGMWTDFFTPLNAENMYGAQIPETADSIVFVRLDNAIDTVTWSNIWNQTVDYAINHADMYFTVEGWGEGENAKSYGTWGTPVVYNTCADVNAVSANTNMTLNEVTVVFIKGSNIYVKDETGTTLVYTNAYSDLVPGDRVSGIAGQAKLYNGLPELAASTAFADLTVVPGDAPVIFDAQAAPTADNVNEVMMFRGVQMPTASFTTARATNINGTFAGEQVAFRNNWKEAFDFDSTKTYTMLGCVAIYNGNIQVYVTNIEEEVAPVQHYYIKNNWNGAEAWTWVEMNMIMNNVTYEYTGVFGGSGVNINTMASDDGSTWFPVADFGTIDSTYVPQALDTIHFVYSIVDSALAVELVGRPEPIIRDSVVTGIHIMNQTGWAQLNLYMWGDAGELFGAWPGLVLDEDVTVEGVEGNFVSIIGEYEGMEGNLIFNDGNGVQFRDLTITMVDTVYEIVVRADGAYFADQVPAEALTIAEATATEDGTELKTRGIVTYINGKNAYIQDATAGILLYNAAAAFTNFSVGDEIIVNAKRAVYGNAPELSNVTLDTILSFGNTVRPITMTLAERAAEPLKNFGMMIRVKSLTIVSFDRYNNPTVTDGVNNAVCYKMSVDTTAFHVGDVVDITAIASFFNGTIQFQGDIAGITMHEEDHYYIKNNWNGGSAWTWEEMSPVVDNVLYEYTGVFGGTGVNINTTTADEDATWFPVADFRTIDSTYVPQALDTIHFVYSIVDSALAVELVGRPASDTIQHYYIKNNWNGGEWAWVEMNTVIDNVLYDYTGVFGGSGVNINTMASDAGSTWFPVADFRTIDSTYVPQAMDTIHFVYSIVDATLAVELVGRPAGDSVLHYYIKNNWEAGSEWTWVEMDMVIDSSVYEYTGVFGGTGVNINTMASDAGAIWFPVEDFSLIDPTYVPQALDTIHFVYSIVDSALAVELVGRPVIEEIQYYIKNNWNGGEWTWEEMTPANDGNITWTYRGIFGGTGVNINNLPIDADAIWFPVDEWIFTTLGYVPEAGDDILFEFDSELLTLTATFMGEDGLDTVTFQREGETTKLIHNGQLYIIRDGKMYNALGAQVR